MLISNRNDHFGERKLQGVAVISLALMLLDCGAWAAAVPLAEVVVPHDQTGPERAATEMFVDEIAKRTAAKTRVPVHSGALGSVAPGTDVVILAPHNAVASLLPVAQRAAWERAQKALPAGSHAEGFSVVSLSLQGATLTVIAGDDEDDQDDQDQRGELFGAGWVLRQMRFSGGRPSIDSTLRTTQSPEKPVRGHQIGFRFKNNTYDAWTLPQFEQQIRDLAIFGANTIQLIAPVSDDAAASPLFPQPPLETLLGISALLRKYGLDCDLYYPEMRSDYADPKQVEAEVRDLEALVKAMPRLDALYIPGGDPGHTAPDQLFNLAEREAAVLHRYHPAATVWISAQGFDRTGYDNFYRLLDQRPAWLAGVFFGPQSRDSFFTQRRRVPARYVMQFYPDIGHTMHAQFPVPQWDPIYALTEGREPICPRPVAFQAIYRRFAAQHNGFVTYSEGVNDDVNKVLWTQFGWSLKTPLDAVLGEYARWFLHREGAERKLAVQAIRGLEEDWSGSIAQSSRIPATRALFAALERSSTPSQVERNGRWESLLYRAVYDDYLQRKLLRSRAAQQTALMRLTDPSATTASSRAAAALAAFDTSEPGPVESAEHVRLFELAGLLFADWGLQLSVKLYGASGWERGANLDRVDTPLDDRAWLAQAMRTALAKPTEPERLQALAQFADWRGTAEGALYDDLGDPANEPHLVRGAGWAADPEMYSTAIDGIADQTLSGDETQPWRLSWLDYAETLYETPLQLRYRHLDAHRGYRVRVTYAGEDYALPLRLTANGREVHPAGLRTSNPETVEFAIPAGALRPRQLTLRWTGPAGSGGSGRGRQVAEVWLLPQQSISN